MIPDNRVILFNIDRRNPGIAKAIVRIDHPRAVPVRGIAGNVAATKEGNEEVSAFWILRHKGIPLFLGDVEGVVEASLDPIVYLNISFP